MSRADTMLAKMGFNDIPEEARQAINEYYDNPVELEKRLCAVIRHTAEADISQLDEFSLTILRAYKTMASVYAETRRTA